MANKYIREISQEKIDNYHIFSNFLRNANNKKEFLSLVQKSSYLFFKSRAYTNKKPDEGDFAYLHPGATGLDPFPVVVYFEDPKKKLLNKDSSFTTRGLNLFGMLEKAIHKYSKNWELTTKMVPNDLLNDVETIPYSRIEFCVFTCRSSLIENEYYESLNSKITDQLVPNKNDENWERPYKKPEKKFSLSFRSYDSLYQATLREILDNYLINEQELVFEIYTELKSSFSKESWHSFSTLLSYCLLALDSKNFKSEFETLLFDKGIDFHIQEAVIEKIDDVELLKRFVPNKRITFTRNLASIKAHYLEGGFENIIKNTDIFKNLYESTLLINLIKTNDELIKFKERYFQVYGTKNDNKESHAPPNILRQINIKENYFAGNVNDLEKELIFGGWELSSKYKILDYISYLKNAVQEAPIAFISYKHESEEHKSWVKKFATDLRKNGVNALLDQWEISLGDSISDYMSSGIATSKFFLLIISNQVLESLKDTEKSNPVKYEFQMAISKRYKGENFKIIGVLRQGERPPIQLYDDLYIDFKSDENYTENLEILLNSLHEISPKPPILPRN